MNTNGPLTGVGGSLRFWLIVMREFVGWMNSVVYWTVTVLFCLSWDVKAGGPIRIMCVGDSITAGYTDNPRWSVRFDFSYRIGLYKRMTEAGYAIQFVGGSLEPWTGEYGRPKEIGTPDLRDLDQDYHRGYAWFVADTVRSNIVEWMEADRPDVILLMIGAMDFPFGTTSNVGAVQNSLSNLVEKIVTARPEVYLIVAQMTPFAAYEKTVVQYNDYIRTVLTPHFAGKGKRVSTVDQYANFLRPGGGLNAIDFELYANSWHHPSPEGYDRMAQTWFEGIVALYPPVKVVEGPSVNAEGQVRVSFSGRANVVFQVDRARELQGPWEMGYTELKSDAAGRFDLTDPNPEKAAARFYRVREK